MTGDGDVSAVGLGRVCRDIYFVNEGSAARFDSRKTSVRYAGEQLGGSVPAIIEVLATQGIRSWQVAGIGTQAWAEKFVLDGLAEKNLGLIRVDVNRTPESAVMLRQDLALAEIAVEGEKTGLSLITAADVSNVALPAQPGAFVYDTRHAEAAYALARRARREGLVTFADPGTLGGIPDRREATLRALGEAHIVFAAANTLEMMAEDSAAMSITKDLLSRDTEIVISTRSDGGCDVYGRSEQASLQPIDVRPVGSSLGAGDLCRGFTLATIMESVTKAALPPFPSILNAVITGLAAAAWRIEDPNLFPSVPAWEMLQPYLHRAQVANGRA
ncbi:PfkB family carbohydrate kinase [Streptomyces albidoflavus]